MARKIITTLFIALITIVQCSAYPILSLIKSNKGLFGYDEVHWELMNGISTDDNHHLTGWAGTCINPGLQRCRPPQTHIFDETQQLLIEELLTYVDDQNDQGILNGTYTKTVKVVSESFLRQYTVEWSSDDKDETTITIDRIDFTI